MKSFVEWVMERTGQDIDPETGWPEGEPIGLFMQRQLIMAREFPRYVEYVVQEMTSTGEAQ